MARVALLVRTVPSPAPRSRRPTAGTPIGVVSIDPGSATAVAAGPSTIGRTSPHAIEVQLPFLQRVLGAGFRVLPIAVGSAEPEAVADLIAALLPFALVVVSTDLSHYLDDATAKAHDRRTADAVLARESEQIRLDDACGSFALRGLVEFARREDHAVRLLDLGPRRTPPATRAGGRVRRLRRRGWPLTERVRRRGGGSERSSRSATDRSAAAADQACAGVPPGVWAQGRSGVLARHRPSLADGVPERAAVRVRDERLARRRGGEPHEA
jgi:hypothetical protein